MTLTINAINNEVTLSSHDETNKLIKDDWIPIGDISHVLGDILYKIEKSCPLNGYKSYLDPEYVISHIMNLSYDERVGSIMLAGSEFHFTKTILTDIYSVIGEQGCCQLFMQDIDKIRIKWRCNVFPDPIGNDIKNGIQVIIGSKDSNSEYRLKNIIFALLYFHAYREYKLKRCIHCDRWFSVPRNDKKTVYCQRNSTFLTYVNTPKGYKEFDYRDKICETAVKAVRMRVRNRIRTLSTNSSCEANMILKKYDSIYNDFYEHPNISNIEACFKLLYGDPAPETYKRI